MDNTRTKLHCVFGSKDAWIVYISSKQERYAYIA